MDDYLTKPFMPNQVVAALKYHVDGFTTENPSLYTSPESETAKYESIIEQAKDNLKTAYDLDEQIIESLLETTIETISEELVNLEKSAGQQDTETVRVVAHSLKGTLLNLRLMDEAAIAEKLQKESMNQSREDLLTEVAKLQEMLKEFTIAAQ